MIGQSVEFLLQAMNNRVKANKITKEELKQSFSALCWYLNYYCHSIYNVVPDLAMYLFCKNNKNQSNHEIKIKLMSNQYFILNLSIANLVFLSQWLSCEVGE